VRVDSTRFIPAKFSPPTPRLVPIASKRPYDLARTVRWARLVFAFIRGRNGGQGPASASFALYGANIL